MEVLKALRPSVIAMGAHTVHGSSSCPKGPCRPFSPNHLRPRPRVQGKEKIILFLSKPKQTQLELVSLLSGAGSCCKHLLPQLLDPFLDSHLAAEVALPRRGHGRHFGRIYLFIARREEKKKEINPQEETPKEIQHTGIDPVRLGPQRPIHVRAPGAALRNTEARAGAQRWRSRQAPNRRRRNAPAGRRTTDRKHVRPTSARGTKKK